MNQIMRLKLWAVGYFYEVLLPITIKVRNLEK